MKSPDLFYQNYSVLGSTVFGESYNLYFGNGVWNNQEDAEASRKALRIYLQKNNPTQFSKADEHKTYSIKYMHNETYGTTDDLLETFWQLFEARQISEGYFSFMANALSIAGFNFDVEEKIRDIYEMYTLNVNEMIEKYNTHSFSQGNLVLLVAHSQGNLFGNKVYANLSDEQKKVFKMVSVATPANNVLGASNPYVTNHGDFIIVPVSGALPTNVAGIGHTFVNSYINGSDDAKEKILADVKSKFDELSQNNCQEYAYYRWIGFMCQSGDKSTELEVEIYGTPPTEPGYPTSEEYVSSDIRQRVDLVNGSCPLNSDDYRTSVPSYDRDGCIAYTFTDTSGSLDVAQIYHTQYQNQYTCSTYDLNQTIAQNLIDMQEN